MSGNSGARKWRIDSGGLVTECGSVVVKNVKQCGWSAVDVYVGRGGGGDSHILNTPPRGRGWLGNPYRVGEHGDRVECVGRFKKVFVAKLQSDVEFREAVDSLDPRSLGCWCAPEMCHGQVIASYIDGSLEVGK
jgi:hypothetical protein